jgi:hypothetical protein
MGAKLTYKPLAGSEIRLLRVEKKSSADCEEISCQLKHVKLDTKPVYVALSYVWGDPNKTKPIVVNGRSLDITENLYDALCEIARHLDHVRESLEVPCPELILWIDAICIDQDNVTEKSMQVPRMGDIYSSSHITLVWLESTKPLVPDKIQLFFETFTSVLRVQSRPRATIASEIIRRLGTKRDDFFYVYNSIAMSDWFNRLWIAQEYVLSPRPPCALVGGWIFELDHLLHITTPFREAEPRAGVFWKGVGQRMSTLFNGRAQIRSKDYRELPLANQILHLLNMTGRRSCTVPHDHVYGILGMVDLKSFPKSLLPDYELPFAQVCKEYAKFVIEGVRDLSILVCHENELEGVPSWVPDLRYGTIIRKISTHCSVSFSADGSRMTVQGVQIARILARSERLEENAHTLRHFAETILTAAAWTRKLPLHEVFMEWMEGVIHQFDDVTKDFSGEHQSMERLVEEFEHFVDAKGRFTGNEAFVKFAYVASTLTALHPCVLDSGNVVHCLYPKGIQEGEEGVWRLKGCSWPLILTKTENGYLVRGSINDGYGDFWGSLGEYVPFEEYVSRHGAQEISLI